MTSAETPTPRKRPVQARSAITVDAILTAAAHILEGEGMEGYTTNAIAARAGVSIGSLYQYFPNKEAITAALVLADAERLYEGLQAASDASAGAPFLSRLEALLDVVIAHQMDRPALARMIDMEERRLAHDPALQAVHEAGFALVRQELQQSGFNLPFGLEACTVDVFAIVLGICDTAGERGETDGDSLKARIRHAVLSYLGGRPS